MCDIIEAWVNVIMLTDSTGKNCSVLSLLKLLLVYLVQLSTMEAPFHIKITETDFRI